MPTLSQILLCIAISIGQASLDPLASVAEVLRFSSVRTIPFQSWGFHRLSSTSLLDERNFHAAQPPKQVSLPEGAVRPQGAIQAAQRPTFSPPFSCCDAPHQGPHQKSAATEGPVFSGKFSIEWTGLSGSGWLGGKVEFSTAALCLTAANRKDAVGGVGLHFQTCESSLPTFATRPTNNSDAALKRAQEFKLDPTGKITTASGTQCIRRVRCGERYLFDLGGCSGPGYTATFEVRKPAANSMDHLVTLGLPLQAVQMQGCVTCGPYLLLERCLARGVSSPSGGGSGCGGSWQGPLGYTKWSTTYIGKAAIQGESPETENIDTIGDRLSLAGADEGQKDMAGITRTDFDGICGSYTSDGPTFDSVFVFHRLVE